VGGERGGHAAILRESLAFAAAGWLLSDCNASRDAILAAAFGRHDHHFLFRE